MTRLKWVIRNINRWAERGISSRDKWEHRIIHHFLEVGIPGSFPGIEQSLISGFKKHFTGKAGEKKADRWHRIEERMAGMKTPRSAGDVFHRLLIAYPSGGKDLA